MGVHSYKEEVAYLRENIFFKSGHIYPKSIRQNFRLQIFKNVSPSYIILRIQNLEGSLAQGLKIIYIFGSCKFSEHTFFFLFVLVYRQGADIFQTIPQEK